MATDSEYNLGADVDTLVDRYTNHYYGPGERRRYTREQAVAVIRAILTGHMLRSCSTAGVMAEQDLLGALGILACTGDQQEADALARFRREKAEAKRALREAQRAETA